MHRRRSLVAGGVAAALALLAAGPASAATFSGTVVHHNRSAHSFVVATKSGRMVAVHANKSPRIGRVVRVSARKLKNGTYGARSIRAVGARRHARLRGVVTYANRSKHVFTVSTRGASVLVHQRRLRGRSARAAADSMPAAGQQVAVDTTIEQNDDLEADDVQNQGQNTGTMDLEGNVAKIVSPTQIQVTADDDEQSGGLLTVNVPDSSKFKVGDEVELKVVQNADGTFTASDAQGDDNENEADGGNDSGDNNGSNGDNGD
jgi:hypothetical protein